MLNSMLLYVIKPIYLKYICKHPLMSSFIKLLILQYFERIYKDIIELPIHPVCPKESSFLLQKRSLSCSFSTSVLHFKRHVELHQEINMTDTRKLTGADLLIEMFKMNHQKVATIIITKMFKIYIN